MTEQGALFGDPKVRRTDPDTSRAGAAKARRGAASTVDAILAAHRGHPAGLTDAELVALLTDRHGPTVVSARRRVVDAGLLEDSGMRRLGPRGVEQIVWRMVGGRPLIEVLDGYPWEDESDG